MREREIEDWIVFKCLGCKTEAFALHSFKREERVLVSSKIQVNHPLLLFALSAPLND